MKADLEAASERKDEIRAKMADDFSVVFDSFINLGGMALTPDDSVTDVRKSAVNLLLHYCTVVPSHPLYISDKEGQRSGSVEEAEDWE